MPCSHCKLSGHNVRTCPLLKLKQKRAARVIQGHWWTWVWHHHKPPEPLGACTLAELLLPDPERQALEPPPQESEMCPICYDDIGADSAKTQCGHVFCTGCLLRASQENVNCPMCRAELVPPSSKQFTRADLMDAEHDGIRQGYHDAAEHHDAEKMQLLAALDRSEACRRASAEEISSLCAQLRISEERQRQESLAAAEWRYSLKQLRAENMRSAKQIKELGDLIDHLRGDRNTWKADEHKAADMARALKSHLVNLFTEIGREADARHECVAPRLLDASSKATKMYGKFCTYDESRTRKVSTAWPPRYDSSWEQWKQSWPKTK